jgi:beta-glucosidase
MQDGARQGTRDIWRHASGSAEARMQEATEGAMDRIETLLAAMTLDEKIGQLNMVTSHYAVTGPIVGGDATAGIRAGRIGSLLNHWGAAAAREVQRIAVEESRLGIPLLLGFDTVHGQRTIFPIPLGEAAAFDPALWERTAREAAIEAAADGLSMTFAPMLDVARDPRWGRIAEGPGEDPLVASRIADAKVRGFQGPDLAAADAVAATAKHFVAYGAATAGRDYASADISERTLNEVYLPPFAAAVAAGVAAVMPSFNDVAGVPMTAHVPLLRTWLRQTLGFDGVIVSDYDAIAELVRHGVAADAVEAAALALNAGVDIDMMGDAYARGLVPALERGLVTVATIDEAVRRVLRLKERLGLFDDPCRRGAAAPDAGRPPARRGLAREAARRAIVLLRHEGGVLPLRSDIRRVAVVGPLADARADMRGPWSAAGDAADPVTILEGVRAALPQASIVHAAGVAIEGAERAGIADAVETCRGAEIVLLCLGESAGMSGEASCRADPGLPGAQQALADAVLALGKPVVVLLSCGRPLTVTALVERADAVLVTWFLGSEAGLAVADVLTGAFNPSGKLPVTWPRHVGQVPIFYAQRPSGRPADPADHYTSKYLDMPVEPLFPFGHGLSYGRFVLSDLRASPVEITPDGTIEVAVEVANAGERAGETVVFLFVRDPVASVARPVLELKDFTRVALSSGERRTVRWSLPVAALSFLGPDLQPLLEPGRFLLLAGQSADRAGLLSVEVSLAA